MRGRPPSVRNRVIEVLRGRSMSMAELESEVNSKSLHTALSRWVKAGYVQRTGTPKHYRYTV